MNRWHVVYQAMGKYFDGKQRTIKGLFQVNRDAGNPAVVSMMHHAAAQMTPGYLIVYLESCIVSQ